MKKLYSLYDKVYALKNLETSFGQVKANRGAAGADGQSIKDFESNLSENLGRLHEELRGKQFTPSPVRRVEIPKPHGGVRTLGVPTVKDRIVQQAMVNVLEPHFEKTFHPSSYAYRKGRSAHQALAKAEAFMKTYGLEHVVDIDLSKCFDSLDHSLIIKEVGTLVSDGSVLKLIKAFLKAGVMKDGVFTASEVGSAQGGVISPLLSNIYLSVFDQEMKRRGIRMVRYADDILLFASTKKDAGNIEAVARMILEDKLRLKVNREKSRRTSLDEGVSYLGMTIYRDYNTVQPEKVKKFKDKVREIT